MRRPGGVTAWVPHKQMEVEAGPAAASSQGASVSSAPRPKRTRHSSLDLEQGMEVVLWNPHAFDMLR